MKMWSGRFRQSLDADFERWQRSFEFDRRLLRKSWPPAVPMQAR
jgi:argininosuccinate lyase